MYSVKINNNNTENLQKIVKTLNENLNYTEDNWNSEAVNPAMLVGYLQATIRHTIILLERQIKNQQENKMENNVKKLEDLGFTNVEAGDLSYYFDSDGYTYMVDDVYDTVKENLNYGTIISGCCGEEVDSDWMICPNCKEHV